MAKKRLTKAQRRKRKKLMALLRLIGAAAVLIGIIVLVIVLIVSCTARNSEIKKQAEQESRESEAASIAALAAETETTTPPAVIYTDAEYEAAGVNELGEIPILMYHRILDMSDAETEYTGGNVDPDGYNRTAESFERDLEKYWEWGYQCIRLDDYLNGKVDTDFGKSPIIITFDDGIQQAMIDGFDADGDPVYSDNSALSVMEKMKEKHPDFNMTATFFLCKELFRNGEEKDIPLLNWVLDHGYDIGNHTKDHLDLADLSADEIEEQIGYMYEKFDELIPGRYVHIVALPYGSPTDTSSDSKYDKIFAGTYNGNSYSSYSSLLCAWTYEESIFSGDVDLTYIKRIRGYDNGGEDFDIEMNLGLLNSGRRYVSDGDPDTIVIPEEDQDYVGNPLGKEIITY